MNRRKIYAAVLTLAMLVTGLCACGEAPAESGKAETVSREAQTSAAQTEASSAGTQTSAAQTEASSVETEASAAQTEAPSTEPAATEKAAEGKTMIYAHIGEKTLAIKPENNSSAEAFIELLRRGDVTVDMHDYGSFEKVGPLGTSLPTNDERITTEPGDVILYQGNQITIYYAPNTWSFTRLGRVQGLSPEELKATLGGDGCTVVFSLEESKGASAEVGVFDFETRTVLLNSGYTMPILGLGTYSLDHETCVNSVKALLKNGGRLIDTAYMYHNEEAVGEGVRQGIAEYGIPREEIFVITKLYPNQFSEPEVAIDMALEKLDIGYIDMMRLHHPGTNDVKAYKAMEAYVGKGKIRSLGLSNWYVKELTSFLPQVTIMPALVQNEIHPYYQEQDVVPFIQEKGIVVQCWYPLGGRGYTAKLLGDETITQIAGAHGVSSAQVILRWDLQRGIVVIPGSSNPEHIRENLDLFGFELTDEEMTKIAALDRGEKHDWY